MASRDFGMGLGAVHAASTARSHAREKAIVVHRRVRSLAKRRRLEARPAGDLPRVLLRGRFFLARKPERAPDSSHETLRARWRIGELRRGLVLVFRISLTTPAADAGAAAF